MTNPWLDFNNAATQEEQFSSDELKSRLHIRLKEALYHLFPFGVAQRERFYIGDIRGTKGESLVVDLSGPKAGMWHDFATGEGGDIIALWAGSCGMDAHRDFPAVVSVIQEWLGTEAKAIPQQKTTEDLGPVTGKWDYLDAEGSLIACVYRYDPPSGKQFRPWDVKARRHQAPESRPLYNQPGIAASDNIILVEGEKSAQALINQGFCATTAMNGASAPIDKTDWSPLQAKHVLIWPDNDEPGKKYAENAAQAITSLGAHSVAMLIPPTDKPKKWDAADAVDEGIDITAFISTIPRKEINSHKFRLSDWYATRYQGTAPIQQFLVEGIFPMKSVSILAAMGDTGKGMLTLKLALLIAIGATREWSPNGEACLLGGKIQQAGSAVIFTAEDDCDEVHRRLERLDPDSKRLHNPAKLIIVPLSSAGGPMPLVTVSKDGLVISPHYKIIEEELRKIPDLKLVVFDPLSSFIHADVTTDPAAGSFITGILCMLASNTGAAVIIAHHMRKSQGNKPITSAEQARDAIRGTSALVDGVRLAYALWPASPEHQDMVFKALSIPFVRNSVFEGTVVKANGPANRNMTTYLRSPKTGLLEDITDRLRTVKWPEQDLSIVLRIAIARAAKEGHPFTHTGATGIYRQRHRLSSLLHNVGRDRLERMVQTLLNQRLIVKGMASGSKEDKWLDVPEGPFARGEGEFIEGAQEVKDDIFHS